MKTTGLPLLEPLNVSELSLLFLQELDSKHVFTFLLDDPEVFSSEHKLLNEGKGSPLNLKRDDGTFSGSPKSNARSYGSYDHIYQD